MMMTVSDFIAGLVKALKSKTLYVMGCFGAPMNRKNKQRYSNNNGYNRNRERQDMIDRCSDDVFGFDCVCLIKGILWGWNADKTRTYGGASYCANDVPDVGANTLCEKYLLNVSKDFSNIQVGEVVWMTGHVGVYVGNGKVIECSPKWENGVQESYLAGTGEAHTRKWEKHGFLPWVDYGVATEDKKVEEVASELQEVTRTYKVKKGDTLSKIASMYNTTVDKIVEMNKDSHKTITRNYIVTGWNLKV